MAKVQCSGDLLLLIGQLVLYVVTMVGGLMTSLGVSWSSTVFNECLLYANMEVRVEQSQPPPNVYVDDAKTTWGNYPDCSYCTFSAVVIVILAIIFLWFSILLSDWKQNVNEEWNSWESLPQDINLLLPSLVFNVIGFLLVVVALVILEDGFGIWYQSVQTSLTSFSEGKNATWKDFPQGNTALSYLHIAKVGNWLMFASLLTKFPLIGFRIYRDVKKDSTEYEATSDSDEDTILVKPKGRQSDSSDSDSS